MDASEPRVRRRGLFFNVEGDPENTESDTAEGMSIRVRFDRPRVRRALVSVSRRNSAVSAASPDPVIPEARQTTAALRSATATGTHQRAHMRR